MNTKQQGDIGVAAAIAYYTLKGYIVSVPLTDNAKYDLVVDQGLGVERVQVKTTGHIPYNACYRLSLKTQGGNQSRAKTKIVNTVSDKNCDVLFVYTMNGDCYAIPAHLISDRPTISLPHVYAPYLVWNFAPPP